jgi:pimeloyl-ACP methyl ester carboxylesterase
MAASHTCRASGLIILCCLFPGRPVLAGEPKVVHLAPVDPASVSQEIRLPDAPPVYAVREVQQPPTIDGKLDDPAWNLAPPMGRMFLDTGEGPMRYDTIARMVRDKDYLYVAVECLHPNIAEEKVVKGARDRVSYQGETVELFLHTDRSIRDYVHVIYDMSGAFTDQRVYNPGEAGRTSDTRPLDFEWNGDIIAAVDVGGAGWRLETRIKIADLAVGGGIDPHAWGANIARSSRSQSGSWARVVGRYHQPEAFGLLTMCEGPLAVEDISTGALALPNANEKASTVHLRLRSLRQAEPMTATVRLEAAGAKKSQPATVTQTLSLGPSEARDLLCPVDLSDAKTLTVTMESPGSSRLFAASLPILRKPARPDTTSTDRFTCAVRPIRSVAFTPEEAGIHLLVWANPGQTAKAAGRVVLSSNWSRKDVWQIPVLLDLPAGSFGSELVPLPVELMKDGQYDIRWVPDDRDAVRRVTSAVEYAELDLAALRAALTPPDVPQVLGKMNCPVPGDPRDCALAAVRIDRLAASLAGPTQDREADSREQVLFALRQLREIIQAFRSQGHYVEGRKGWFETAFYSTVDGSAQPYSLSVPADYDKQPDRKWPLVIGLHGGGGTHGGEKGYNGTPEIADYINLLPLGRGPHVGFNRLAAVDVVQAIQDVQSHYRVDPDAVFLFGGSMGGYGTFAIASRWPDLFAACRPVCGGGAWCPLEQMCNLPTVVHHGLLDISVASSHSRFVAARMNAAGCPLQLYLHPEFGHRVTPMSDKISAWEKFRSIRRDSQPRRVIVDSDLPTLRKAYWLSIPRPADPQKDAWLQATFVSDNHLALSARNVEWAKIALPLKWIDRREPVQISVEAGNRWTEIATGDAKALYVHWDGDKLAATTQPSADVEDPTAYVGGGVHSLFWLGRPVRIVYGTAGSVEQTQQLERLAQSIRRYHSDYEDFEVGGFPVLKDAEVTDEVLKTCDLVLLGSAQENSLAGRMVAQFPVKLRDGQYVVETTPPMQYAQEKVAFSLFYRNPLKPDRRVWWFAGVQDHDAFAKIARRADGRLFGMHAPELTIVDRTTGALLATGQLDARWRLSRPAPLQRARDVWPSRADMEKDFGEFLRKTYAADICLVGVVPPGDMVEWESLTIGEALRFAQKRMMALATLTGQDLQKWLPLRTAQFQEWKLQQYQQAWAGPAVDSLDPKRTYQVLLSTEEASSCEEKAIHPQYLRFVQESDFENAVTSFGCQNGSVAGRTDPAVLQAGKPE